MPAPPTNSTSSPSAPPSPASTRPAASSATSKKSPSRHEYDDSPYLEEWAVTPYALLAIELRDAENGSEDIYLELGGANSTLRSSTAKACPVDLTFPFALGFSLDDFYQDAGDADNEFFGFLKLGAEASMDLDMIPANYGNWTGPRRPGFVLHQR